MEFLPAPTQRAIWEPVLGYLFSRALKTRAPLKYLGHLGPNEICWKSCVEKLFELQKLRCVNKHLYNAITNWFVCEWGSASIATAFTSEDHAHNYFRAILDNRLGSFQIIATGTDMQVRIMSDSVIVKIYRWCPHDGNVYLNTVKYYECDHSIVRDVPCDICREETGERNKWLLCTAVPRLRNHIKI